MSTDGRDSASLISMQNSQLYRTALSVFVIDYIHFALTEAFARIGVESSLVETTTERVTPVVESTVTLNSIRQKDILELIQEQAVTVIESATEPTEQVLEEKVKILNDPSVAAKASAIVNQLSEGIIQSASNIAKAVQKSQKQNNNVAKG